MYKLVTLHICRPPLHGKFPTQQVTFWLSVSFRTSPQRTSVQCISRARPMIPTDPSLWYSTEYHTHTRPSLSGPVFRSIVPVAPAAAVVVPTRAWNMEVSGMLQRRAKVERESYGCYPGSLCANTQTCPFY